LEANPTINAYEIPGKWNIRKMIMQDLDEVLSIAISNSLTPWSKNMFVEEMRNPVAYCFVMVTEEGSKQPVIGFICFRNVEEESELLNICVHQAYRQLGIGKKLMEFYIDFSRRRGSKTFYLEVHPSNHTAIHLYQLFSYQSSGIRKEFYQGKFDALLMMKKA
jgi:ribosomal-protein-alanine N-acetyltransferase